MLFGEEIGRLHWNSKAGRSYFFFSPQYFLMHRDIAPIIAPKSSPDSRFAIYGNQENKIYQKLPPFIADSLPDDWGNILFDQWFKDNGFHDKDKTPVAKLSFIGSRAMGAFEFLPCDDNILDEGEKLAISSLYSLALKIEQQRDKAVILPEESLTKKALLSVGTSAGGRFKKAVIAIAPDGSIHSGQTSVRPDWRYCIVKFNNETICQAELEQTYYEMAVEAGIEMSCSELITVEGVRHFLTERFDRLSGKKVLTMSLAAINPDAKSYEDLFKTCGKLGIPDDEKAQLFRRLSFNVLASNTDDHAKNFSFVMDDEGLWHISKAYDLNFIFRTLNAAETDHCFALRGKCNTFTRQDLMLFAKEYGIKSAASIIAKVCSTLDSFESKARSNGVRGDIIELVGNRLTAIRSEIEGLDPELPQWPSYEIDGHTIHSFHFEKDEKGAIRIIATVDGKPSRKIIARNHPDYLLIAAQFNDASDNLKKSMARKFLLKTNSKNNR